MSDRAFLVYVDEKSCKWYEVDFDYGADKCYASWGPIGRPATGSKVYTATQGRTTYRDKLVKGYMEYTDLETWGPCLCGAAKLLFPGSKKDWAVCLFCGAKIESVPYSGGQVESIEIPKVERETPIVLAPRRVQTEAIRHRSGSPKRIVRRKAVRR